MEVDAPDSSRSFLTFQDVPDASDASVYAVLGGSSNSSVFITTRTQDTTNPSSVTAARADWNVGGEEVRLGEYVSGNFNSITETANPADPPALVEILSEFSGSTLQAKWWEKGTTEPTDFTLEATSDVTEAGECGIGHWRGTLRVYAYGVGIGGADAPREAESTEGSWAHTETTSHNDIGEWAFAEVTTSDGVGTWTHAQITTHDGVGNWSHAQTSTDGANSVVAATATAAAPLAAATVAGAVPRLTVEIEVDKPGHSAQTRTVTLKATGNTYEKDFTVPFVGESAHVGGAAEAPVAAASATANVPVEEIAFLLDTDDTHAQTIRNHFYATAPSTWAVKYNTNGTTNGLATAIDEGYRLVMRPLSHLYTFMDTFRDALETHGIMIVSSHHGNLPEEIEDPSRIGAAIAVGAENRSTETNESTSGPGL